VTWIRLSVIVQVAGLMFDALWHGVLRPGMEPRTTGEMVVHLGTVHLVLYVGVIGLLASTAWVFAKRGPRAIGGTARLVACLGAVLQAIGETWHAVSHLRLHANPLPELFGFGGLIVAVAATFVAQRAESRRAARPDVNRRRAA
jgi:hypothetical protein